MNNKSGIFTISMDFELYWGVRDKRTLDNYGPSILGVYEAIPRILDLFKKYQIHATWATVGFLFFKDLDHLKSHFPSVLPSYDNTNLSPYLYAKENAFLDPRYHFAPHLIQCILDTPGQEIGTHTFSHYYCLELGQSRESFLADLFAASAIAREWGIDIKSIVFPRNLIDDNYLPFLKEVGIHSYRGQEASWVYKISPGKQNIFQRFIRFLDAYINLTGHHTYHLLKPAEGLPLNIPSSRFLRPYSGGPAFAEQLRLSRILTAMQHAARHRRLFHLWWHPHNFGLNLEKNLLILQSILECYNEMKRKQDMKSMNMQEVTEWICQD